VGWCLRFGSDWREYYLYGGCDGKSDNSSARDATFHESARVYGSDARCSGTFQHGAGRSRHGFPVALPPPGSGTTTLENRQFADTKQTNTDPNNVMKKTLATFLTVVALVASAYSQGTLTFNNSAASIVKVLASRSDPTPTFITMPVGGGHVELLWAEVGTTDLSLFSSVAITDFHTAPGRFNGGAVTIPITVAGGPVALVVRGWTGPSLTWAGISLCCDMFAYSSIFTLAATGNPTTVPPGIPVSINPAFPGLTIDLIPEPSSMALAGLGTVSLLLFRRRVPARPTKE